MRSFSFLQHMLHAIAPVCLFLFEKINSFTVVHYCPPKVAAVGERASAVEGLRVHWLLDHTRGSRGPRSSRSMLRPLLAQHPHSCSVSGTFTCVGGNIISDKKERNCYCFLFAVEYKGNAILALGNKSSVRISKRFEMVRLHERRSVVMVLKCNSGRDVQLRKKCAIR